MELSAKDTERFEKAYLSLPGRVRESCREAVLFKPRRGACIRVCGADELEEGIPGRGNIQQNFFIQQLLVECLPCSSHRYGNGGLRAERPKALLS